MQTPINKAEGRTSDPKLTYFTGSKGDSKLRTACTTYGCGMLSCTYAFSYSDTIYLSFEADYPIHHPASHSQF